MGGAGKFASTQGRRNYVSLNKHLVLRDADRVATISRAPEEEAEAGGDAVHDSGKLAHRRHDRRMDGFGGVFNFVERSRDELVGADNLQACTVESVVDRSIEARHVAADEIGGVSEVAENFGYLRTDFREHGVGLLDRGKRFRADFASQRLHASAGFSHAVEHAGEDQHLQDHGSGGDGDE